MNKFIVERMDILTREKYPREKMIRLVLVDNVMIIDKDDNIKGRGYYVYKDKSHIEEVFRKKRLNKLVPTSQLEDLKKEMLEIA